jgi:hypothetical protein
MNVKSTNAICRGCTTSYQRNKGVAGRYCSNVCKVKYPKKKKRCSPECRASTLEIKQVTFKNGVVHSRQSCKVCNFYKYVPRGTDQIENKKLAFKELSKELSLTYDKSFYTKPQWLELRYKALLQHGRQCMACNKTTGKIHVDHIKPRSKYPELELSLSNLQVLCEDCNLGKSNTDETDWR